MGKETDRQTYYPIVEFVFMLVWSQNFGFTLGKVSTIIGLRASWENPQFCSQLRLKKKKKWIQAVMKTMNHFLLPCKLHSNQHKCV